VKVREGGGEAEAPHLALHLTGAMARRDTAADQGGEVSGEVSREITSFEHQLRLVVGLGCRLHAGLLHLLGRGRAIGLGLGRGRAAPSVRSRGRDKV
jgi:hypothetical protein